MILIADSGSTKTDWIFADNGLITRRIKTRGINPVHMSEEEIGKIIQEVNSDEVPLTVNFYGAGCIAPFKNKVINRLQVLYPDAEVSVESDLLGAARAVCGHNEGIACILGTGSNSCLYDGSEIVQNVPPLGYILGDEGSGTAIGKRFLNALFKGELSERLRDDYLQETGLTYADIINKVYREPLANRFLASCSVYVAKIMHSEGEWTEESATLKNIVAACFRDFFMKNVCRYKGFETLPIGIIGSIAYHYKDVLSEVAVSIGCKLTTIDKSPSEGLVRYHFNRS